MYSLGENSDMASNPPDDEAERARRDGEAFGRQIGERAMAEVRRVVLTLADVNTQQAIAVGTLVTERPPHRSGRAGFPHPAPTVGV